MERTPKHQKIAFLISEEVLDKLVSQQEEILNILKGGFQNQPDDDYITEDDAKKMYPRGTTWFWNKRKSGELQFYKLGQTVYYKRADLLNLISKTDH